MALSAGTRLGPYEILSPIGAGGMGEVYKARDTRLNRLVALKLLPLAAASDPDRLYRFEREARAASALNHPAIITIYDFGQTDAQPWISMELVEGKTLRQMIASGPLPLRRALDLAAQIADGLAKAHDAGIVHRDLKPENVMVSEDGFAKILDFGVARLATREPTAESPTGDFGMDTRPGTVMGTLAYMSPEQASGAEVDFRSDQFSFGALLYEMLAGRPAFERSTTVETLSAILRDDPRPLTETTPPVPLPVRWIAERCLQKLPADRYAATRDLARDLASARDHLSEMSRVDRTTVDARARPGLKPRERAAWILALALASATFAFAWRTFKPSPESVGPAVRFLVTAPEPGTIVTTNMGPPFALAPDGRTLVAVITDAAGTRCLWLRRFDSLSWQRLEGTEDARRPFWSPDGRTIGFFTQDRLKRVSGFGGDVQTICNTQSGWVAGGTWGRDDVIVFATENNTLHRVPAAGGAPTPLFTLNRAEGETTQLFPLFLPDGRQFVFVADFRNKRGIYLGAVDSQDVSLLRPLTFAEFPVLGFTAPDHLLFTTKGGVLMAQRLDVANKKLVGDQIRVAEGIEVNPPSSTFSASSTGALAFSSGSRTTSQLTWVRRDGTVAGTVGPRGVLADFSLSPDGRQVAFSRFDTDPASIWVLDLFRGTANRPSSEWYASNPVWAPDGSRIAFASVRDSPPNLYLTRIGAVGGDQRLTRSALDQYPQDWSRDGRLLVYTQNDPDTNADIWVRTVSGVRDARPIVNDRFAQSGAAISPDGRWLAYASKDESQRADVYVTSFPQGGDRWAVSTNGGFLPQWSGNGRELYYVTADRKMMMVPIESRPKFEAGAPKPLFQLQSLDIEWNCKCYAVAPDGRFLVNAAVERKSASVTVVLDWRAGVRQQ
jgi:eukaryotic-like serine/threonine-protein kinase